MTNINNRISNSSKVSLSQESYTFQMKKGVAMVLCRSMSPVFSEDEFTGRSVAANLFDLKLNETLHLALQSNFALHCTVGKLNHSIQHHCFLSKI